MAKQEEYSRRRPMHNPAHPGAVLKEMVVKPLGLTVTQAAERLDVDRKTLSRVLNGKAAISLDMALRLSKALGTSAAVWLGMQQAYDLWQAEYGHKIDLSRVRPLSLQEDRP